MNDRQEPARRGLTASGTRRSRTGLRLRSLLAGTALCTGLALSGHAFAQSASPPLPASESAPPPSSTGGQPEPAPAPSIGDPSAASGPISSAPPAEQFAISPGGVDLRTGRYAYTKTDLEIGGSSDSGGLSFVRQLVTPIFGHVAPFGNMAHNWDILIQEKRVKIENGEYAGDVGDSYRIGVYYGGKAETFDSAKNDYSFRQVSKAGYARLTWSGDRNGPSAVYNLSTGDGTVITFRPIGSGDCSERYRCAYASQVLLADGTTYDLQYETRGGFENRSRLQKVTSSRGYVLLLRYETWTWQEVTGACVLNIAYTPVPSGGVCPANAQSAASYTYGGPSNVGFLTSATDPAGGIERFGYSGSASGYEQSYTKPGQVAPWLTNSVTHRPSQDGTDYPVVYSQSFADGRSYVYVYNETPPVENQVPSIAGGAYTNQLGERVEVEYAFPIMPKPPSIVPRTCCDEDYQLTPGPVRITDALGRTTTSDYCDRAAMAGLPSYEPNRCLVSVLQSYTVPEGDQIELKTDLQTRNVGEVRRKTKPGTGLPDIVTSNSYHCGPDTYSYCAKPTSSTDANNNRTDYVYDAVHGGLLSETGPAVGGVRPQVRHEYVQRYAWILAPGGGYQHAGPPVWLLWRTRSCRTTAGSGAGCAGGYPDETITTYDYGPNSGPNNLWVRGMTVEADGRLLRTCYGYDQQGRRISETQPNASVGACS